MLFIVVEKGERTVSHLRFDQIALRQRERHSSFFSLFFHLCFMCGINSISSSSFFFFLADEESHPSATTKLSMTEEIPPQIAILSRTNSNRSLTSEAESYRSAKNLPGTDSSSYASVNDRCLSPSTASYHTALGGETSSSTGYETPTPQLEDDDGTLSSQSSLSDLSRAETLEPTIEGKVKREKNKNEEKKYFLMSIYD